MSVATKEQMQAEFESWVTSPPFERSIALNSERSSWPGTYCDYATYLAWEAWQAAFALGWKARGKRDAALCRQKVKRDPEYGGRWGGYGEFYGLMNGEECADAIRKEDSDAQS